MKQQGKRMLRSPPRLGLFLCTVLATAAAVNQVRAGGETAEETIRSTFRVGDAPKLVVDTFNGAITVQAGAAGVIAVEVRKRARAGTQEDAAALLHIIEVRTEEDGGTVRVSARCPSEPAGGERQAAVRVTVPASTAVDLLTGNGAVQVTDLEKTSIRARSRNGPIRTTHCRDVHLEATTSNGHIDVTEAVGLSVAARTSQGPVRFEGTLAAGDHTFASKNGRITLALPGDSSFIIDASTGNGPIRVENRLDEVRERSARRLVATAGSRPDVRLHLTTGNGAIELRQTDPPPQKKTP